MYFKRNKSFIKFSNNKDPNALIIIQADHGYKDHIKKILNIPLLYII